MRYFKWFVLGFMTATMAWAQTPTADQYLAAGQSFYVAKDYFKAFQYFQAAAQLNPNSEQAFQGLGNSEYMLGQKSQALSAYQRALVLNPNNLTLSTFIQNLQNQLNNSFPQEVSASITQAVSQPRFEIDLMGGVDNPVSPSGYGLSFGGGGNFYFMTSPNIGVGASVAYYSFSYQVGSGSASELEVLAAFKYVFGIEGSRPYLVFGAGLSDYNDTYDGSVLNPVVSGGLGYELKLDAKMNLFLEGRAAAIIASNTVIVHVPVEVGINFNL